MREKPQIINRHTLAKTRLFHIEELELRFANGVVTHYERLLSPSAGAVLVVPLLEDGTVLLVREYAAGVDRYELSFPKGRIEPGEEILAAAHREMTEEIGPWCAPTEPHHLHEAGSRLHRPPDPCRPGTTALS